ncbi:MAG: hypothetical protein ACREJU_05795 [Nitrospiraceae bacterium]
MSGPPQRSHAQQEPSAGSFIATLHPQARDAMAAHLAPGEEEMVIEALRAAQFFPAAYKRPLAMHGLTDPWNGLTALEEEGRQAAALIGGRNDSLSALIDRLEAGMSRASAVIPSFSIPGDGREEDQIAFLATLVGQAQALRTASLRRLTRDDRRFLFDHAAAIVEHFSPQRSGQSRQEMDQANEDRRFLQMIDGRMDYGALSAAAKLLAQLDNAEWFAQIERVFREVPAINSALDGVTGDLLLVHDSPSGLIVIGGTGSNTYHLDRRFALVIDVGGDDSYQGAIAAATDMDHGVSVVIDLDGNDRYDAAPFGLATGRLGVGLLVDRRGDDVYHLGQGSGGTGFAGIGLFRDGGGHDHYIGGRFTQGAAIGGLGVLIDDGGSDTYTSFGYAIGFGGPWGMGAVIDRSGDDSYQCGDTYPSRYNQTDAPHGKPGDTRFQYDAFGIGAGAGIRIVSGNPEHLTSSLAGGWGLVVDLEGNDRYRSANFSQGVGYFFGMGMKLDLAGNDEHAAARYGHGAAAHYGVGLFIDGRGNDYYASTGPVYNGGTAWDLSVSLCIDAGDGSDVYDLRHSDGLGRADHRSWSVFIEEGGRDRYVVPHGMGAATDRSLSGFLDLAGDDEYVILAASRQGGRGNGRAFADDGGVFVDR